jgi:hypothetical protein
MARLGVGVVSVSSDTPHAVKAARKMRDGKRIGS